MGKGRIKRPHPSSRLLEAMKFLSLAQKNSDNEQAQYCKIGDYCAASFDGVLAAGTSIQEDLQACPHTNRLLLALARCAETYAITQTGDNRLQIRSGEFGVEIPCLPPESLSWPIPDAALVPISDAVTDSLRIVGALASDKAKHVAEAAVLLQAGSAVATDREVILEAWHGFDLPTCLLPKSAVTALCRAEKKLTGFGYNGNTATFWYGDGSWFRTQLYRVDYPNVQAVLNVECNATPVPKDLFEACRIVAPFGDGNVVTDGYAVRSGGRDINAHMVLIDTQMPKRVYSFKNMKAIDKYAQTFDPYQQNCTLIFGKGIRGAVAHAVYREPVMCQEHGVELGIKCDCVPF